ncbi:peroxiredoxin Q/BCP [Allocatelliglobosispora scoriae]|uniref:thioredoxin-dependent peroxiredoxin n=1 Tax=Allocatelliglobosispora scoriae TaxID=643052 RepID=A0A841BK15_9ACTN|nr:peroxiredoxin [Allocatelliglobosispora scoriae]MBB5867160.1 peroxiredoxin Q/BCP [Allocatelliglobosispora scoriae]
MAAVKGPGVRDAAPDFTLASHTSSEKVSLGDFRGKTVVLYFYPKDDTRGCTAQACSLRDSHEVFTDAGAVVIGVSSDSVESHKKFADRYNLPFTLLSDEGGEVRKAFGVPATFGLLPGRVTYVIDGAGIIRHVFNSQMNIGGHVDGALAVVKELQAAA